MKFLGLLLLAVISCSESKPVPESSFATVNIDPPSDEPEYNNDLDDEEADDFSKSTFEMKAPEVETKTETETEPTVNETKDGNDLVTDIAKDDEPEEEPILSLVEYLPKHQLIPKSSNVVASVGMATVKPTGLDLCVLRYVSLKGINGSLEHFGSCSAGIDGIKPSLDPLLEGEARASCRGVCSSLPDEVEIKVSEWTTTDSLEVVDLATAKDHICFLSGTGMAGIKDPTTDSGSCRVEQKEEKWELIAEAKGGAVRCQSTCVPLDERDVYGVAVSTVFESNAETREVRDVVFSESSTSMEKVAFCGLSMVEFDDLNQSDTQTDWGLCEIYQSSGDWKMRADRTSAAGLARCQASCLVLKE